jgi:hypothetical protein
MSELYSLKSAETYLPDTLLLVNDVLDKYIQILVEYFNAVVKQKFVVVSPNVLNFITLRGLDTITHVFKYILLYTRNLEATYHHAQKSIYFYIEFTSQVSEHKNAFLQLSSKDALTYVYKKTIYLLNMVDYKPTTCDIKTTINTYMQIYKNLADNIIETRKDELSLTDKDTDKFKLKIIQVKTDKKTTSEWIKYLRELNVIDE